MTKKEIVDYLKNDLKTSVLNDVFPCLQLNNQNGGYFAVPRLVLSYVDYLGALYHGYLGRTNNNGRRIFADGRYAKAFLNDVFSIIDPNYKKHGDLLWEIYRNGTIHLYEPLKLENKGKTIDWLVHKRSRICTVPIKINQSFVYLNSVHLVPLQCFGSLWKQPISIDCLYKDLLCAIDEYANLISTNSVLELKFRQVANALQTPEQTKLTW